MVRQTLKTLHFWSVSDNFETLCIKTLINTYSKHSKLLFLFWTFPTPANGTLQALRNYILCIIRMWSLICSLRVYISSHFLPILLKNYFFLPALFVFSSLYVLNLMSICIEFKKIVYLMSDKLTKIIIIIWMILFIKLQSALWFCSHLTET